MNPLYVVLPMFVVFVYVLGWFVVRADNSNRRKIEEEEFENAVKGVIPAATVSNDWRITIPLVLRIDMRAAKQRKFVRKPHVCELPRETILNIARKATRAAALRAKKRALMERKWGNTPRA